MQHEPKRHNYAGHSMYKKLGWMMALSFASMYILMYSMVDRLANVIPNINQIYMAALMTAPMLIIELLLMGSMYATKKRNVTLIGLGIVVLIGSFVFIRQQTAVSDKQFLKSMIPHHAAAILMVEGAELKDPDNQKLAQDIIRAQQKEIDFMKAKLHELESKPLNHAQ